VLRALRITFRIAEKDLRVELRTRQAFLTVLFFAFLILVIFKFAFDPGEEAVGGAISGILWVALLFPGVIQLNRSFQQEMEEGTLFGLLLAPVDRSWIFLGKFAANSVFLLAVDGLILLAFLALYNITARIELLWLAPLVALAGIAFCAVGTLFAAMVSTIRNRDVLLPILLFPILVPVILAAVNATREILEPVDAGFFANWVQMLAACCVIFAAGAFVAFEYVVGE
jgi:heme exporter protein B